MRIHRTLYVLMAAMLFAFGNHAYAASPRDDIVQAYILLKLSNSNYAGHRAAAIKELETVGHELGLDLKGKGTEHQHQMQSDAQMAEAGRILREARYKLDAHDREHAADHVDRALHEIDEALRAR
jgi:hypothetical protein